jgi:hypothetical protein
MRRKEEERCWKLEEQAVLEEWSAGAQTGGGARWEGSSCGDRGLISDCRNYQSVRVTTPRHAPQPSRGHNGRRRGPE